MKDDTALVQFATVRDLEYLDAIRTHGSRRQAAKALKVDASTIDKAMWRLEARAAAKGYSPAHDLTHPAAPGQKLRGASTLYRRGEVEPVLQWVKTSADDEAREAMVREAVAAFIEDCPAIAVAPMPLDFQSDIIPWIQVGDGHLGLLAHAAETSEGNFDLKIAEQELCEAIAMLVDEMPACERIVINDLGDMTHRQNPQGISESGHAFSCDDRMAKMIRVYSRTMRFIVDRVLTKARHVDIIVNQGNHSRVNDLWMRELLTVAYGHTGRVHVLDNDNVFIGYRMGNTLVMTHHSDKCKPERLVGVMTSDFRKDFGETQFHYIDIGHVHHHFVSKEHPSVIIESWNHLAANDKWAHEEGYRARKCISVVLRSRTYGEVGRRMLPIEAVKARLAAKAGTALPARRETYSV